MEPAVKASFGPFEEPQQTASAAEGLRLVTPDADPETVSGTSAVLTGPAQELFRDLFQIAYPELQRRLESGDERIQDWLARFIDLGALLGVRVTPPQTASCTDLDERVSALLDEALACRWVSSAAYRLQLNAGFTFRDASAVVPYLRELGVTTCYVSPILQARAGSSHGYDVCDHSRISADLGGETGFAHFAATLREHGLGLILDAVPNHMGIGDPGNAWWMDVLENGPGSVYAAYFDVDWHPVNPDLQNKVLLPLLEDQYGRVLEAGKIRLDYDEGSFFLWYHQTRLPVSPCTYPAILEGPLAQLASALEDGHHQLRELRSILTALNYLPARTDLAADKIIERHREKEVIKHRLAALCNASPLIRATIDAAVQRFNGTAGDPHSFDLLNSLIERQAYRLAFWRVAAEEINYRRFFDVNELAAIRMELPEVFRATHQVLIRLLAEGKATGLRIDHPDGLRDPAHYFKQLQEQYLLARAELKTGVHPQGLARALADGLARHAAAETEQPTWPLYVVAEKILTEGEQLPPNWAVDGTTGYEFLNAVNGLFIDSDGREAFDRIYRSFTGASLGYNQRVGSAKKMTMLVSMASEINALAHQLDRIAERNRRCRDFTLNSLTFALREVIASLPVYRTYITGPKDVSPRDRRVVEEAVAEAKRLNPRTAEAVFDFVCDAVLLCSVDDFPEADRPRLVEWALKFQQLTGPIMAKSVEDTVFYSFNRLVSLNEVGGSPDQYGLSSAAFHRQNGERLERWPHSLLATSTHDTKRSEDVRARLNALSELAPEWQASLARWGRMNSSKKMVVDDQPAPDRNDEYLLYQTLLAAWSAEAATTEGLAQFRARITAYMQKATKEAKIHTSWINPNEEYDEAVGQFVARLLASPDDPFVTDLLTLQQRVAYFGYFNSLAQVLLKLTCPGVPDLYQGTELWNLSLVDPDNRRPVDFQACHEMLAELQSRIAAGTDELPQLADELLAQLPDGRIKLFLIYQMLNFRRAHEDVFARGEYLPLEAVGARRDHVVAFARVLGDTVVLVIVPRQVVRLTGGQEHPPVGPDVWGRTRLLLSSHLARTCYKNLFTGETIVPGGFEGNMDILLGRALDRFPVAVLWSSSPYPG
jgi:(1->4)-alpha-D-glucan 1-alpha-D-glucosylmutase